MINKKLLLLIVGLLMTTQMIYSQVPSYVPTNGLVGYWPFNGNANDESGNGNNGTPNGVTLTTDRNGNANSAYSFDGISNYIQTNYPGILGTSDRSVSFWAKQNQTSTTTNSQITVGWGSNTCGPSGIAKGFYCAFNIGGSGVSLDANESSVTYNPQSSVSDNIWHHYVVVKDAQAVTTSQIKIYQDGVLLSVVNGSYISNGTLNTTQSTNLTFGKRSFSCVADRFYNGQLDDIGIWNRALTQQEISNMYNGVNYSDTCNAVSGSLVNGLVGYWPFCGNANDQSGNGNNGTVNGATLTTDRFGNPNSAYEFNMNYIKVNNSSIYNFSDNLSINVWYKISNDMGAITLNTYFVSKHQSGSLDSSYTLYNENNCGPTVYQTDVSGNISFIRNSTFCDTSSWHMLTLTFNNPNMIMYLDGIYYSTITANNIKQTLLPLVFGGTNNSSNPDDIIGRMKGKLDDIGIWNRALTQQEITQLYNQNQCQNNITVTDTLIINVGQLSYTNPVTYANNITIYPNPANTQVNISFNNITDLTGGNINIINSLGQQVTTTPITLSGTTTTMQLNTWGGTGLYFVQILNAQGQIVDIKKIILQ
jgi:hypothetical protein